MSIPMMPISNRRVRLFIVVTVSLLLVLVGMRVSGISAAHSPNSRSPRAVIESAVKDSQEAGSRKNAAVAVCQYTVSLNIPTRLAADPEAQFQQNDPITPGRLNARAPPCFPHNQSVVH